ncbi:MAG: VOC family protein [Dysgonamonadaceae bacterium]|jgi:predicted enzyme related to lactoylglutathione lyase|nr:VOC family protein [Dysgonamonadaceae bacterium]
MEKLIAWVEIPTADFERAVKFYNSVFKMELPICGDENEKMAFFKTGEGAIVHSPYAKPSENGVIVSFNVPDSIEETISRIEQGNGKVIIPKTKIEAEGKGYFAVCTDSENNRIGLYE